MTSSPDGESIFDGVGSALDKQDAKSSQDCFIRIPHARCSVKLVPLGISVSGGPEKAVTGTLSIMVGGDRRVLDESMVVLKALGKDISYMSGPGTGQATKLVNQILH